MNLANVYNYSKLLMRNISFIKLQNDAASVIKGIVRQNKFKAKSAIGKENAECRCRPIIKYCNDCDNTPIFGKSRNRRNNDSNYEKKDDKQLTDNVGSGRWYYGKLGSAGTVVSAAFSFNLFRKSKDDDDGETPEDKLITAIKRSVLCIQREQYDKAEQMLHLALRMAQDIQNKEGVTYIFDLMANLAMEREQFKKAEKLFADVMKRLFAEGYTEDNPKILHISSKLAHMAQLQGELEKAKQGFIWTLKKLEENIKKMPDDRDVQELFGLTKNWFGQLLMTQGKYAEAKRLFKEAFDCLIEIYGTVNEEAITILNNLSVACVNLEDFAEAKRNLVYALRLVKELKDSAQEGILQANLGLIYLREGLLSQAKETCTLAWRTGKKQKSADAIEQAEYCLNEIKSYSP